MEICYEAIWKDHPHISFQQMEPPPPANVAPSCCTPVLTTRGDGGGSGASGHGGGADLCCVRQVGGRGGSWEAGRRCRSARRARRYLWGHVASWGSVGQPMEEDQRARPAGRRQSPDAGKSKLSPERLFYPILEIRQTRGVRGLGKAAAPQRPESRVPPQGPKPWSSTNVAQSVW